VRVAVYNAHWATLGGGEQVAGGLASALGDEHDVELLVEEEFDAVEASERLGFDVQPFPQRLVEPGTRAFLEATEGYDLLVNSSFASTRASRAARSLYYVHFPVPFPELDPRRSRRLMVRANPFHGWVEYGRGFQLPEFHGGGAWTSGKATISLVIPRGEPVPFSLRLSADLWPAGQHPHVRVEIDDDVLFDGVVMPRASVTIGRDLVGRGVDSPSLVRIVSETFVPRVALGMADDRTLGVVVSHVRLGPRSPAPRRGEIARLRRVRNLQFSGEFLESYQCVVANSPYTATWVERLWGQTARVLEPPVRSRAAGTKARIILAVGRFFPNVSGHSKKQVELVHAFRLAGEQGLRDWELHLVGGCKDVDRAYAEEARKAAVGLPVRFHINAPGEDVADLFAAAELFWHASGYGEDLHRHPDRFEHFGITVVEAMSAGAVPVVYEHGGPADIVREARCGRVFSTLDQLATETLELVADVDQRRELSARALTGSRRYSYEEFAHRSRELVDEVLAGPPADRHAHGGAR